MKGFSVGCIVKILSKLEMIKGWMQCLLCARQINLCSNDRCLSHVININVLVMQNELTWYNHATKCTNMQIHIWAREWIMRYLHRLIDHGHTCKYTTPQKCGSLTMYSLIWWSCTCTQNELQGAAANWTALRPSINMYQIAPRPNGRERPRVNIQK